MRLKKTTFQKIAISVLALVVILFILLHAANMNKYRPRVEKAVAEAAGMDVIIKGDIKIVFFPSFGLSINSVSVLNRGTILASSENMVVGFEFVPLLKRQIQINLLYLIRPEIFIEKDADGRLNFERQRRLPEEQTPFLSLDRGDIRHGMFTYHDRKSGNTITIKDIDMSIKDLSFDSNGIKHSSFDGDFRCRELSLRRLKMSDISFHVKAAKGIIDINPLVMQSFGDVEKGIVKADLTGNEPVLTTHYTANKFRLDKFSELFFGEKIMGGYADMALDLTTRGKSMDEMKRQLNGRISIEGENLMLYTLDLDSLISKIEQSRRFSLFDVGAFFLVGPLGVAVTKGSDFVGVYFKSRDGESVITKLVSDWKIERGIGKTEDVALSTKKNRIVMKGEMDFVHSTFEDMTVAVVDARGCVTIDQKIYGSFSDPKTEKLNILSDITGPAVQLLKKAKQFISREKCEVFYDGAVRHPQ